MSNNKPYTITVGDLLDALKHYNRSDRLFFGNGDLSFHRIKSRGDDLTGIEFNQLYQVTHDPEQDG
jgi:hypothetical protein